MWWFVACSPEAPTVTDSLSTTAPTTHSGTTLPVDSAPAPTGETGTPPPVTTWPGAAGTFTGTTAGRDWVVYVPTSYDPEVAAPLVVGFHGAGDSGANFAAVVAGTGWTAAAEAQGFALLIPDTLSPYADFAVWSGNPNNDFDEMAAELDDVLALCDTLGETWHLDPAQRHAFGFSDGGLFLAVAGFGAADRLGALGIFGYGWGGFTIVEPPRPIAVAFVVGSADTFEDGARQSEAWLASQGHDTRLDVVPGVGHLFSGLMGGVPAADLSAWLLAHPR